MERRSVSQAEARCEAVEKFDDNPPELLEHVTSPRRRRFVAKHPLGVGARASSIDSTSVRWLISIKFYVVFKKRVTGIG
jgi:hypothetical protein